MGFDFSGGKTKLPLGAAAGADGDALGEAAGVGFSAGGAGGGAGVEEATAFLLTVVWAFVESAQTASSRSAKSKLDFFINAER